MELDDIPTAFDELISDIRKDCPDGARHYYMGFVAEEQIRAGLFPEAMHTLETAAYVMYEWEIQLTRVFDRNESAGAGPTLEQRKRDDWKLSVLALGHAKAGKFTEAINFAKQIACETERRDVLGKVLGAAQNESDGKSIMQILGSELASLLREAAELAEKGKLEEAIGAFRVIDQRAKCFAGSKKNSCEGVFERRAVALADLALKLRAESGEMLPEDFAKKPVPGAPADGAKNKGTRG